MPVKTRHFVILFTVYLVISTSLWTMAVHDKDQQLRKSKANATYYKDIALRTQVNYEGARDEADSLRQDLADRDERLAAAAAREALAKKRASRSRRQIYIPNSQSQNSPISFSGGLRAITMYCPTGNSTASGKTPARGMVATLSRSIPFGTRVSIEGLGVYVVEDRIGHGSEFDIFTPSCSEADGFGRIFRRVTILG